MAVVAVAKRCENNNLKSSPCWKAACCRPMMFVTPSVKPRCFYVDFKDGSEKWESFLVGPLLKHLRERFNIRQDREGTLVTGISMGGNGFTSLCVLSTLMYLVLSPHLSRQLSRHLIGKMFDSRIGSTEAMR